MRKQQETHQRSCLVMFFVWLIRLILLMIFIPVAVVGFMNLSMILPTMGKIVSPAKADTMEKADLIVVLGASAKGGTPSVVLQDRLDTAIALYNAGLADKILMTGDGTDKYYNEVKVMRKYARSKGVPSKAILKDPNGTNTYNSMANLVAEQDAQRVIIVTQKYHLYRSVYIARKLGVDAYGVYADHSNYKDSVKQEVREIAARCKDYLMLVQIKLQAK